MKFAVKKSHSKNSLYLVLYYIFAIIFASYVLKINESDVTEWCRICSFLALLLLITQSVAVRLININFFSLEYVFLLALYVFYLGQVFLLSISYDFGNLSYSVAYSTYGTNNYINSTKYSLLCITFVFGGLAIGANRDKLMSFSFRSKAVSKNRKRDISTARKMLYISLPFEIYSFIVKIYAMLTNEYSSAHEVGGGHLIKCMSGIFFAAIVFYLMDSSDDKQKCRMIFHSIVIYELIRMLTGERAYCLIQLIIYVYIYYKIGNRINWKVVGKIIPLALILVYFMIIIRNMRSSGLSLDAFNLATNGFFLYDAISEFGVTARVVLYAFAKVTEFAHGKSITCAFLAIIPGWTYLFGGELINQYYTEHALNLSSWGSAFISDFYFDFGFAGGIASSCIYGMIVGFVFLKFNRLLLEKSYMQASCYAYFSLELIFTVRSFVFRLPRYFTYFMIIYTFCRFITVSYRNKPII